MDPVVDYENGRKTILYFSLTTGNVWGWIMPNERRDQVIRDLAYKLWQEAGEPPYSDLYFWLEAERQLEQTTGSGMNIHERRG